MVTVRTSSEALKRLGELITKARRTSLKPPPKLNLVQWADTYRHLPDNSAEPGRWKTKRMPPAREPMLAITTPGVKEVTVMCCIQAMKTELMLNTALFYIHQEPSPMMYVALNEKVAEAWSKERFTKSVKATPVTRDIFADNRRGEGNTILQKQFPGGQISIVSARNPGDLAMRACRIMLFDEVDKYPTNVGAGSGGTGGEGDAITVAWGRATTYGRKAKKVVACSPTTDGRSRVQAEYLKSSQGVFYQKCPHCGFAHEIMWQHVHIPVNENTGEYMTEDAVIVCNEKEGGCGKHWSEGDRRKSIDDGYWVHKHPHITWHRGFKMASMASPFTPISTLALEYINALANPQEMKAFYNTRLALTWKEVGEQPEWDRLYERRELYEIGSVPEGVLMITCAIDVQLKGIYWEYIGWGPNKENWAIDKGYEAGSVATEEMELFIHALARREFVNSIGVMMPTEKTAIDSGDQTQRVYNIVRNFYSDRLVAIKGDRESRVNTTLGTPSPMDVKANGKKIKNGVMLWPVGSSVIKEEFYSWLTLRKPTDAELEKGKKYPAGFCHFPEYDEEYFKQITAEQLQTTENAQGYTVSKWVKTRDDNHHLDTRAYNRAAAAMLQIDRMTERDWEERRKMYYVGVSSVDSNESDSDTNANKQPKQRVRKKLGLRRRNG